jgi:hypothetical protein
MRNVAPVCVLLLSIGKAQAQSPLVDHFQLLRPELTISVFRDFSLTPTAHACDPSNGYGLPLYFGSAFECETLAPPFKAIGNGFDATGALYQIVPNAAESAIDVVRGTDSAVEPIARLLSGGGVLVNLAVDSTNGRLYLAVRTDTVEGIVVITGLPTMFDTLLTFVPDGTLTALTPAHPDGFRSADSLQVWTGNVRTLPDWSQATPLVCAAALNPSPGEIVNISDPLPAPLTGQATYYIAASQSGTQRRLGRQYVNGTFSARDPSALPVCQ